MGDMVLDTTDMDTDISARGLLMPNPRLMLMPLLMLTTDTTAVDTVTDTDSDTAVTTVDTTDTRMPVTDTVTLARGPLMPNPRLMPLLMLTTVTTAVDRIRLWPLLWWILRIPLWWLRIRPFR